jgi:hypothetical protein
VHRPHLTCIGAAAVAAAAAATATTAATTALPATDPIAAATAGRKAGA